MAYTHFSHNGKLLPIDQAAVPLSSIEYAYGYGVYESIRVSKGIIYFIDDHCDRLMRSASIIGLEHPFTAEVVRQYIKQLVEKLEDGTFNLKILLIGASLKEKANLYITASNPLFPDRKLYKNGVYCNTRKMERIYPQAKTLNMLSSYIAYRDRGDAYDTLLVNNNGQITEGTRTNLFAVKDRVLYSPPADQILLGVVRDKVTKVARDNGYQIVEQSLPKGKYDLYDGAFLTSTSSKIMPIKSIDDYNFGPIPSSLKELMDYFDEYLKSYTVL